MSHYHIKSYAEHRYSNVYRIQQLSDVVKQQTWENAKKPVPWLRLVAPPSLSLKAILVSITMFLCLPMPPEEEVKAMLPAGPDRELP